MVMMLAAAALGGCKDDRDEQPEATTRLETRGIDTDIYEFTPKSAPYMQCIFASRSDRAGLFCFEKRTP